MRDLSLGSLALIVVNRKLSIVLELSTEYASLRWSRHRMYLELIAGRRLETRRSFAMWREHLE